MANPVSASPVERDTPHQPKPSRRARLTRRQRERLVDVLVPVGYLAGALFVLRWLWRDPNGRVSAINPGDQSLSEWMLAHSARWLTHLENPFFTARMGTPDGLNVMANTSFLGLGIPLTPVTLVWGPGVTYLVCLTLALAGTAAAWYFLLSRHLVTGHLVTSRPAAFAGAALIGFSPGMLSQAQGHVQIAVQMLVPVILWRVILLTRTVRPVRDGFILGLLVAYQCLIGEEVLFLTALGCFVCALAYLIVRPAQARRMAPAFLKGLGIAAACAGVLLAYPLYQQFAGPLGYDYLPKIPDEFSADILSYLVYSGFTLGGSPTELLKIAHSYSYYPRLAPNATEMSTFFGWPLLVVVACIAVLLWRSMAARLASVVIVVFGLFSLGVVLVFNDRRSTVPGPWAPFGRLPLTEAIVPGRLALIVAAAMGILVALGVQRAIAALDNRPSPRAAWLRANWRGLAYLAAVVVALVPLLPRPFPVTGVPAVPQFFASGQWRQYVTDDGSVLVIPPTRDLIHAGMRWSAHSTLAFRVTNGYYLSPDPQYDDGRAGYFSAPTATEKLLIQAAERAAASTSVGAATSPATGKDPITVTESDRSQAAADLRRREVDVIVLPTWARGAASVRIVADQIFGPGVQSGDVWFWDVRELRSA
jgi:hypothetical protein